MTFSTLWFWLVRSSEDSAKWSKTVKGIGVGVVTVLTIFNFDTSEWTDLFKYLAVFAEALGGAIAAWMTVTGAARKIKLTKLGRNSVLNDRIWE